MKHTHTHTHTHTHMPGRSGSSFRIVTTVYVKGERYTPGEEARYTSNDLLGAGKMSSSPSSTRNSFVVSPDENSTAMLRGI